MKRNGGSEWELKARLEALEAEVAEFPTASLSRTPAFSVREWTINFLLLAILFALFFHANRLPRFQPTAEKFAYALDTKTGQVCSGVTLNGLNSSNFPVPNCKDLK